MTQEEMQKLRDHIHEQVKVVAQNPEERHVVVDRLQGTFVDATKECLNRLAQHKDAQLHMYEAVLGYLERASRHDGRVAVRRALEGKFTTAEDVQSWIDVWDPL